MHWSAAVTIVMLYLSPTNQLVGQYHVLMFVQQEALIQSLRFVVISG